MIGIIVAGGISFLFVIFSTSIGVNYFKTRNIGQPIREELNFHEHKKGTPTMGGVFLIIGTFVGFILSHINFWTIGKGFKIELLSINPQIFYLLLIGTLMGLVGLVDDYLKVKQNRNVLKFKYFLLSLSSFIKNILKKQYPKVIKYKATAPSMPPSNKWVPRKNIKMESKIIYFLLFIY